MSKKGLLNAPEICHIMSESYIKYDCENAELIKNESDSVADKNINMEVINEEKNNM